MKPEQFLLFGLLLFVCTTSCKTPGEKAHSSQDNLVAFTKLLGYIRYFHPSEEAAAVDWDAFAVYGAEYVRDVANPPELQAKLEELFLPLAPTLLLFPSGEAPPDPVLPPAEPGKTLAWRHLGVGLGTPGPYVSARSNRADEGQAANVFGNLMQLVDAAPLRGKQVRLSVEVKAEVDTENAVQLWLRVDRPNRNMGFFDNMADRPIRQNSWQTYTIEGPVAEDAERIAFGSMLLRKGKTWLDNARLEVRQEDGNWEPVSIANGPFEKSLEGWSQASRGYRYSLQPREGGGEAAMIESLSGEDTTGPFAEIPELGTIVHKDLGGGLSCKFPLVLPDAGPAEGVFSAGFQNLREELKAIQVPGDASSQAVREAAVAITWNIFQHFYPYWDQVDTDWHQVLTETLPKAVAATDSKSFLTVLQHMTAQVRDGHVNVWSPQLNQGKSGLPIHLAWVEERLVVWNSRHEAILPGDEIVHIDGEDAKAIAQAAFAKTSGSPQWQHSKAMRVLRQGPANSQTTLDLLRGDQSLSLAVAFDHEEQIPARDRPSVEQLEDGIFYIDINIATMEDVEPWTDQLAQAKGVVFDVRGYPRGTHPILGHLTDSALTTPTWQVPKYLYPDQENRTWRTSSWQIQPRQPRFQARAIFLIDGGAISYAETFMSIVKHHELGTIVGQPTAGANGNVNRFPLPGGYTVTFTGMRVEGHDGSQHHLIGVLPDITVTPTVDALREGRDLALEKAIQLIKEQP